MGDKDIANGTDTFVPYDHITSRTRLLETISQQVRDADEPASSGPTPGLTINSLIKTSWKARVLSYFRKVEAFGATSGVEVYKYIRTRLSWKQRVLSWFRGS